MSYRQGQNNTHTKPPTVFVASPELKVVNKPGDHGVRPRPVRPSSADHDLLVICWEMIVNYSRTHTRTVTRGLAKEGQSVGFSSICPTVPLIPHHLTPPRRLLCSSCCSSPPTRRPECLFKLSCQKTQHGTTEERNGGHRLVFLGCSIDRKCCSEFRFHHPLLSVLQT